MPAGARYTTLAAMVLAPVVASAIVAGAVLLIVGFRPESWGFVRATFLVSVIVALPITLVIGPIAFLWMQRRRLRTWYHYAWVGGAVALIAMVATMLAVLLSNPYSWIIVLFIAFWAVPIGIMTAVIGWLIRRPDRDQLA